MLPQGRPGPPPGTPHSQVLVRCWSGGRAAARLRRDAPHVLHPGPVTSLYEYAPHPHVEKRKQAGPPTTRKAREVLHGTGAIARFNAKVGLRITLVVGTMWCAYLFMALALVSAPTAFRSASTLVIVGWLAQTFLQLVLLPIIIVGQNVQANASDARAQATYDDAAAVLEEARRIQEHLQAQDHAISEILEHARQLRQG